MYARVKHPFEFSSSAISRANCLSNRANSICISSVTNVSCYRSMKESPLGNVRQCAYFVDRDISYALGRSEFEGGI